MMLVTLVVLEALVVLLPFKVVFGISSVDLVCWSVVITFKINWFESACPYKVKPGLNLHGLPAVVCNAHSDSFV